jgi:hypothetical protein
MTVTGTFMARAAYATPWPKLPADATTTPRCSPTLPASTSSESASHVPRPLNDPMGLGVSSLTTTGTPICSLSGSEMNCGESRKALGMR